MPIEEYVPEGTIKDIEPNKPMKVMADILKYGKDAANWPGKLPKAVPLLGGMGAGDILFGQGPELVDSMTHGFSPVSAGGTAARVDHRVLDAAFMPGPLGAAGLAVKGGKLASQKLMGSLVRKEGTNLGRRDFLQDAAGAAAATALPVGAVKALSDIAPTAAKTVAAPVAAAAARGGAVALAAALATGKQHLAKFGEMGFKDYVNEMSSPMGHGRPSVRNAEAQMGEWINSPGVEEAFAKALGDIPPEQMTPEFLEVISTQRSPHTKVGDHYPTLDPEFRTDIPKWLTEDHISKVRQQIADDPAVLKRYEDYMITGKRAPADEAFEHINFLDNSQMEIPKNSRFSDLHDIANSFINKFYQ